MKAKQPTERVEKISISLTPEMATWLRRSAAKKMTNVSQLIRAALLPSFESRHAK
jgi:hypothetical protein